MNKLFYIVFLSVASAKEVGVIFELNNSLAALLYLPMLLYVIGVYFMGRIPDFVWVRGLSIIGIASLISLLLMSIGKYSLTAKKIEACIDLYVWFKSVVYISKWENKKLEE